MRQGLRYGAVVALGLALPLQGQIVRGTLTEEGSRTPLGGAVISLVPPEGDSVHARVLSDASGDFVLRASPGRWRVRAELIGHRTVLSDPFDLPGLQTPLELSARVQAVALEGLDVTAGPRRCLVRPSEEGVATARAWDQARKALESSYVGQQQELSRFEAVLYERDLDPGTLRVRGERSEPYRHLGARPFSIAPPESLAAHGFVQATDSGTFYFAPDERVLLSDEFLDGHCFRLRASDDRPELVGLEFEPVRGSRVTDIDGVLWLDRESGELRSLEYGYVNLRLGVPTDGLGGGVRFQRLPTGVWIPRRWWIRMPTIVVQQTRVMGRERTRQVLTAIRERGGEVLGVVSGGVRIEELDRPRVQGIVYDSTRGRALEGASVFLVGTEHATRTDRYGRFTLTAPEGDFVLTFAHPRIDTVRVSAPRIPVAMRPELVRNVRLALPTLETLLVQSCAEDPGPVVTGVVVDERGRPVAGALVTLGWPAGEAPDHWRSAPSDALGRFVFCGSPSDIDVLVRAAYAGFTSPLQLHHAATGGVVHADLVVGMLRTAHLTGRVTDADTGQPLPEASIRIRGTGQETLTDLNGEFVLAEVPPGPQVLEVDHLLYGAQSEHLDLEAGSTLSLGVSLAADAIELAPLTITVDARRMPGERGFRARMEAGIGFFMSEEQIVRNQPLRMSDVFNSVPGLTVACGTPSVLGSGCVIGFERARTLDVSGRERPCPVQYFVDGSPTSQEVAESFRPVSLMGIEVYNGLSEVPPEYRRGPDTRCGVIAIWLKARG